jgi:hypothetical protein
MTVTSKMIKDLVKKDLWVLLLAASAPFVAARGDELGTFGQWRAFTQASGEGEGKGKSCIAMTPPALPTSTQSVDHFFLMVSGPYSPMAIFLSPTALHVKKPAEVRIGSKTFPFKCQAHRAYSLNPAQDGSLLKELETATSLTFSGFTAQEKPITRTYSLAGIKKAILACRQACPSKAS